MIAKPIDIMAITAIVLAALIVKPAVNDCLKLIPLFLLTMNINPLSKIITDISEKTIIK